jgi:GT2 family glycosyltransferase
VTPSDTEITVIIPHHNGADILRECLASLFHSTQLGLNVMLVDNASSDDSCAMVAQEFPAVKIIHLEHNLGFAGGCNAAIKLATTPFVLILNNDTIHAPGWIESLLAKIKSDESIAVVQPKILSYYQRDTFDYSGACGGEMDIFGFPFARGRIIAEIEKDHGQYDKLPDRLFWASGTAFLARTDVVRRAGMFDETFFAHMEELDLQWRIQLLNYRLAVEPRAVIYHRSGYTLGAESPLKKYLNHRNSLIMLLTNYRFPLTIYIFPLRLLLDYLALGLSLVQLDFGRVGGIIKAHLWILLHPRLIWRKRRFVLKLRVATDRQILKLLYHGSVALQFYLCRQRTYHDLRKLKSFSGITDN